MVVQESKIADTMFTKFNLPTLVNSEMHLKVKPHHMKSEILTVQNLTNSLLEYSFINGEQKGKLMSLNAILPLLMKPLFNSFAYVRISDFKLTKGALLRTLNCLKYATTFRLHSCYLPTLPDSECYLQPKVYLSGFALIKCMGQHGEEITKDSTELRSVLGYIAKTPFISTIRLIELEQNLTKEEWIDLRQSCGLENIKILGRNSVTLQTVCMSVKKKAKF